MNVLTRLLSGLIRAITAPYRWWAAMPLARKVAILCSLLTFALGVLVLIPHPNTILIGTMSYVEAYWIVVSSGYALITYQNLRETHRGVEVARRPPTSVVEVKIALKDRFTQAALLAVHLALTLVGFVGAFVANAPTTAPRTPATVSTLALLLGVPIGLGLMSVELHLRRREIMNLLRRQIVALTPRARAKWEAQEDG